MIGVAADESDLDAVREFFELFKTPWEPARTGRRYRVALSIDGYAEKIDAAVLLIYGTSEQRVDREAGVAVECVRGQVDIEWTNVAIPIHTGIGQFRGVEGGPILTSKGGVVGYRHAAGRRIVWRIGYHLLREIRHLLTQGQSASHALTPTLELHIALLRHVLVTSGVSFVEIPPRPHGHQFICCLTHDVDFFGIRRHKLDRTLAGFVARASVASMLDLIRGRRSAQQAARNWLALLSLPLVFARWMPDFWCPFDDYARVEKPRRSTFFLVPFKDHAGVSPQGSVDVHRAVRYDVTEIKDELRRAGNENEMAVHGIDAWRDARAGRTEMARLTSITGQTSTGIRMHWLYFDRDSPEQLDAAGFNYDSTWGYNDAVGYKAGTSQVFRFLGTQRLVELPMSIMDTALFYPSRMGLSQEHALRVCRRILANAKQFGGTIVINWHERSLAPERLWGEFYQTLLEEVGRSDQAWFAAAEDAVDWFRWRRSIRFTVDETADGVTVGVSAPREAVQAAVVRIHHSRSIGDRRFDGQETIRLAL